MVEFIQVHSAFSLLYALLLVRVGQLSSRANVTTGRRIATNCGRASCHGTLQGQIMKDETKLVHLGRGQKTFEGTVNMPVYRASTILSPDVDSYIHRFDREKTFTDITYLSLIHI